MSRYLCVLTVCAACQDTYYPDVSAWFSRAEIHIDAARPNDLAVTDIELMLSGGEEGRYVRVERVRLMPTGEPRRAIGLVLDGEPLFVPAYAQLYEPLINKDIHNADFVDRCQSTVPLMLELGFPAHRDELAYVWEQELVVFCP